MQDNKSHILLRAIDRFSAKVAAHAWSGYIVGAGLAFDPLPPGDADTFVRDDKRAFAMDICKLSRDRNRAMTYANKNIRNHRVVDGYRMVSDTIRLREHGQTFGETSKKSVATDAG